MGPDDKTPHLARDCCIMIKSDAFWRMQVFMLGTDRQTDGHRGAELNKTRTARQNRLY